MARLLVCASVALLCSCNVAPPPPKLRPEICISPQGEEFNAPHGAGAAMARGDQVTLTDRHGYRYPVQPGFFGQPAEGWRCKETDSPLEVIG